MADGPIEIKVTLDKSAVQRDLQRMKEKVRQGQAPTSAGQLPGVQRPDSGRVSEVDRAVERERDARIAAGGGESSFAAGSSQGARGLLAGAEAGEFGAFAAGVSRFAGTVARKTSEAISIFHILDAMTTGAAVLAPVITKFLLDAIAKEFPWISKTLGQDTAELVQSLTEAIKERFDRIKTAGAATSEALDIERAKARLGTASSLEEFKGEIGLIQKIKENDLKLERAQRRETLKRMGETFEKQLMGGAH